jgi:hypothetical protein
MRLECKMVDESTSAAPVEKPRKRRVVGGKRYKADVKCVEQPTTKQVGKSERCVCKADNGQWLFLKKDQCPIVGG